MARPSSNDYSAEHIQVLEGLDPVRKRPGMYIGSTGPTGLHHLVWEVVDNAVDEAMAGWCTRIDVSLLADGGVRVADNGRGIPVDEHPQYKGKSAAEIVMTTLHAGGKFGGGGYKVSGGLHGVGVSVVNALSSRVVLEVDRGGKTYRQEYAAVKAGRGAVKPGVPQGKLKVVGQSKRGHTGTSVTFWPDPDVFEEVEFRYATIAERLQIMAFLNRGLTIALHDERPGHKQSEEFTFDGGIVDFVRHLNQSKEPLFKDVGYFSDKGPEGEVEVAWQWNTGYHEGLHSFANGISTTEGGMHVEGFRRALTQAVNRYAKDRNLVKAKDADVPGRRRARGAHRHRVGAAHRSAVRGPDQGEARQHRDALARRARNQHPRHPLARGAPEPGEGARRQGVERGAGALGGEVGARSHPAQDRARRCGHARQARRLRLARPRRRRAVPRRGRLRRRFGTRRARPEEPGDPPVAGQGAQRRAGVDGQGRRQRRDPVADRRDRRRDRRRLRRRQGALRPRHHPRRRRCRRRPHPHAADHVLLPADDAAGGSTAASTSRSRRCTPSRSAARSSTSPTTRRACG